MSGLQNTHKQQSFSARVAHSINQKTIEYLSPMFFRQFLNLHSKVGDSVTVTITTKKPKRTVSQNNYLWEYYSYISSEIGHTPEEIHEWSKTSCMPTRIVNIFGDQVRMKKSTTELTVSEFIEYVQRLEEKTGVTMPPLDNHGL